MIKATIANFGDVQIREKVSAGTALKIRALARTGANEEEAAVLLVLGSVYGDDGKPRFQTREQIEDLDFDVFSELSTAVVSATSQPAKATEDPKNE